MANTFTTKVTPVSNEYVLSATAEFDSSTQELGVTKISSVKSVSKLNWAINSGGYIKLSWVGSGVNSDEVFAILSGNGRWELGSRGAYVKPDTSTGAIKVTTVGFVALDTYTLVLIGAK